MNQLKALLIDDDAIFNLLNRKLLMTSGAFGQIDAVTSGIEGLRKLQEGTDRLPDVIFLDIMMPVMNGFEFLEQFHQLPSERLDGVHVVMLSSSLDPRDIDRSRTYPLVNEFIEKPLSTQKLSAVLQKMALI